MATQYNYNMTSSKNVFINKHFGYIQSYPTTIHSCVFQQPFQLFQQPLRLNSDRYLNSEIYTSNYSNNLIFAKSLRTINTNVGNILNIIINEN